jgi:hypothetical protein
MLGKKNLPDLETLAAAAQKQRDERHAARAIERREPARPLATYAGPYHSDRLGGIDVSVADGKLWATHGVLRAELVPAGGDAFRIDWTGDGFVPLTFLVDAEGRVTGFDWDGRPFERR